VTLPVSVILTQGKLETVIAVMLAFMASTLPGALGIISSPNSARGMASRAKHMARACRPLQRFLPAALLWVRSASLRFAIVM
jgi:hypothetical protein